MHKIIVLLFTLSLLKAVEITDFINHTNCDQVIDKEVYTVCYDYTYKGAKYVAYTLTGDLVHKVNIKKRGKFYTEKNLPKPYRSHTKDYIQSGYDRGHLANDASFDYDPKVLRKTYSMVNIIPQAPIINRYLWTKAERYERVLAKKLGSVTVINGVTYDATPERIGKNQIAVPSSFWKILYNTSKAFKKCFYYENNLLSIKEDKLENHIIECNLLLPTSS